MGTNYYWIPNQPEPCVACGHIKTKPSLHIGKSSAGWAFGLHIEVDQLEGVHPASLEDWEKIWSAGGGRIEDEYGRPVEAPDMLTLITRRVAHKPPSDIAKWNRENSAFWDEAIGLSRCKIDPRHCIGHGKETYDLIVVEFS